MTISYRTYGYGSEHVIVMHDWFFTSYDAIQPHLNTKKFTYAFVDLRGYGRSRAITGECSIEEATQDILAVADALKWSQFHIIGHSMSGMIAQYLMYKAQKRILSCIAITPIPACGSPVPEEVKGFLEEGARNNDEIAEQMIGLMTSHRYGKNFAELKVRHWRESSSSEARVAYLNMFTETNFVDYIKGLKTPILVLAGAHDSEGVQEDVMHATFGKWYSNIQIIVLEGTGHYPMQEVPIALTYAIEAFLEKTSL
ncbi:MAG: alpha/beta hydrolase [Candidatus Paracaedimonas acanthamoebae]|uniref:Alpha/beta hydrolase n=1 Tax=Candidatus Paracaedimonas acanthamoebae TaxID=244581 RepID=A0A8J7TU71_9PROT|nr:alpha/beta hydrolase [Candidatus Paracaedimonas acanthamoebae]